MKSRYLVAVVLMVVVGGAIYFLRGPIPDDRAQHQLLEAARRGDIPALAKLHAAGASLDAPASYEGGAIHSGPPLYEAIAHERLEAVRWLITHGANPNVLIATETPLDVAEERSQEHPNSAVLREITAFLKASGAKRLSDL